MLAEPPRLCLLEVEYMRRRPEKDADCRIGANCNPFRPCKNCSCYVTAYDRALAARFETLSSMMYFGLISPNEAREMLEEERK